MVCASGRPFCQLETAAVKAERVSREGMLLCWRMTHRLEREDAFRMRDLMLTRPSAEAAASEMPLLSFAIRNARAGGQGEMCAKAAAGTELAALFLLWRRRGPLLRRLPARFSGSIPSLPGSSLLGSEARRRANAKTCSLPGHCTERPAFLKAKRGCDARRSLRSEVDRTMVTTRAPLHIWICGRGLWKSTLAACTRAAV